MLNEYKIISHYLSQLIVKKESLSLKDDVAVVNFNNSKVVITTDTIIEDQHFFSQDSVESIIHKLLHVNLSDVASSGASPKYWNLALSLPKTNNSNSKQVINEDWMQRFVAYAKKIQKQYKMHLIGGDTTFTHGPLTITATIFATSNKKTMKRQSAIDDDIICISNNIGATFWGFAILYYKNRGIYKYNNLEDAIVNLTTKEKQYLINRYHYPSARVDLGKILINYANACTDISDGFLIDVEKIATASNKIAVIDLKKIKFDPITQSILKSDKSENQEALIKSVTSGDEYELIFTIKANKLKLLQQFLNKSKIKDTVQEVGKIINIKNIEYYLDNSYNIKYDNKTYSNLIVIDSQNNIISPKIKGWEHTNN